MTGGFIISFPLLAFAAGTAADAAAGKDTKAKVVIVAAGLAIGAVLNYAVGTVWFAAVSGSNIATGIAAFVAPFVVNDIMKFILAYWLGMILKLSLIHI